jgi:hypothetical protein
MAQNDIPTFFVPHAVDRKEAESVRESTKKFMESEGYHVATDRRIYSVSYSHDGKKYRDVVGQPSGLTGEEVLVIFDAGNLFLSCSANRGVLRGGPVLIGKHWDTREREFTPDADAPEGRNA